MVKVNPVLANDLTYIITTATTPIIVFDILYFSFIHYYNILVYYSSFEIHSALNEHPNIIIKNTYNNSFLKHIYGIIHLVRRNINTFQKN